MSDAKKASPFIAVFAIALTAFAFSPDMLSPIGDGQARAANEKSNNNGKSGSNRGNGGRSASKGSSSRGLGSSSRSNGSASDGSPKRAPVTDFVRNTLEPGQNPGDLHSMIGSGHSFFNANENAINNAAYSSRLKRFERYLQADADATRALVNTGGIVPTDDELDEAQRYLLAQEHLDAHAVIASAETSVVEEADLIEAQTIIANSVFADEAEAQAAIDGYSLAYDPNAIIQSYQAAADGYAAFEEADNQPYDEDRRTIIDDLAAYLGISF